jgi:hypothetical protein
VQFSRELTQIFGQFHGESGTAERAVSQVSESLSAELTRVSSDSSVTAVEFRLATVSTQFTAVDGPAGRYFELAIEVNFVSATVAQSGQDGQATLFSVTGASIGIEATQLEIGQPTGIYERELPLPNADEARTRADAQETLDIVQRLRETQKILASLREHTLGYALNLISNGLFGRDVLSSGFDT